MAHSTGQHVHIHRPPTTKEYRLQYPGGLQGLLPPRENCGPPSTIPSSDSFFYLFTQDYSLHLRGASHGVPPKKGAVLIISSLKFIHVSDTYVTPTGTVEFKMSRPITQLWGKIFKIWKLAQVDSSLVFLNPSRKGLKLI